MRQNFSRFVVALVATGTIFLSAFTESSNARVNQNEHPEIHDTFTKFFPYSSFKKLDSVFVEISSEEYTALKSSYRVSCKLDSTGVVEGYGFVFKRTCNEICVDYLEEEKTGNMLNLPCDYDHGINGLLNSPACKQFLVYSSYDRANYNDYYDHRSELFIFQLTGNTGLAAVKPSFGFQSNDWSITDVTWISEKQIALKIYKERADDETAVDFRFYKMNLKKR